MPNVNFASPLRSFDGRPMIESDTKQPITLRVVSCNALTAQVQGDAPSGVEKVKRFDLARRISANDVLRMSAEDVVLVKATIDRTYGTLLTAAAYEALEASEAGEAPVEA